MENQVNSQNKTEHIDFRACLRRVVPEKVSDKFKMDLLD